MFKCMVTGRMSQTGDKLNKIVVEKRERTYTNEFGEVIGQGWEIVKEINATDAGVKLWHEVKNNLL